MYFITKIFLFLLKFLIVNFNNFFFLSSTICSKVKESRILSVSKSASLIYLLMGAEVVGNLTDGQMLPDATKFTVLY